MPEPHVAQVRYRGTDAKVATFIARGKVKARGKGACCVCAYTQNGVNKRVKVTVRLGRNG